VLKSREKDASKNSDVCSFGNISINKIGKITLNGCDSVNKICNIDQDC
jgi:hypothetical protein